MLEWAREVERDEEECVGGLLGEGEKRRGKKEERR